MQLQQSLMSEPIRATAALVVGVLFTSMVVAGQSVEISGSLRSTDGEPLGGTVDIFEEGADLVVTAYSVERGEEFRISAQTQHGILVHFAAEGRPPDERFLPPGTSGRLRLDVELPEAQQLSGRVLDRDGRGIGDAAVHVRYHEPGRPLRRAAFHVVHRTDSDGYFRLRDVGVGIPFFVDIHGAGHLPKSFGPMAREKGHTDVGNLVLEERGGTVVVQVHDRNGLPVSGARVVLLADPAGYRQHERGSLLHGRAFHQRTETSRAGIARFGGVPAGRIRIHSVTPDGEARDQRVVVENQTLEIQLVVP